MNSKAIESRAAIEDSRPATDSKPFRDHVRHPIVKRNAGIVVHHAARASTTEAHPAVSWDFDNGTNW